MFLRATTRRKDGKEHRYWSIVENRRLSDGRVLQRHVLYLGETNASQERAWRKSIKVFDDGAKVPRTLPLFPQDRCEGVVPQSDHRIADAHPTHSRAPAMARPQIRSLPVLRRLSGFVGPVRYLQFHERRGERPAIIW